MVTVPLYYFVLRHKIFPEISKKLEAPPDEDVEDEEIAHDEEGRGEL